MGPIKLLGEGGGRGSWQPSVYKSKIIFKKNLIFVILNRLDMQYLIADDILFQIYDKFYRYDKSQTYEIVQTYDAISYHLMLSSYSRTSRRVPVSRLKRTKSVLNLTISVNLKLSSQNNENTSSNIQYVDVLSYLKLWYLFLRILSSNLTSGADL